MRIVTIIVQRIQLKCLSLPAQSILSRLSAQHRDEVPINFLLQQLNNCNKSSSVSFSEDELEPMLHQLEGENRVMYRQQVVWII